MMFQDCLVEGQVKTNRSWTVFVSFGLQIALIGGGVVVPLLHPEMLPKTTLLSILVTPTPPAPLPPPPPKAETVPAHRATPHQPIDVYTTPRAIPQTVAMIDDKELPQAATGGVQGGVPGGIPGGPPGGVFGSLPPSSGGGTPPPPVAPASVKSVRTAPLPVGGNVQAAKLIYQPKPLYPTLARAARVSGVVRFTAIIGREGAIENLTLISGPALLVVAAQDAVKQWRYKPTLLNNEPVEVVTQIDVIFTLSGN